MKFLLGGLAAFAAYEWWKSQGPVAMTAIPAVPDPIVVPVTGPVMPGGVVTMAGVPRSAIFADNGSGIGVLNGIGRFGQRRIA